MCLVNIRNMIVRFCYFFLLLVELTHSYEKLQVKM